MKQLKYLLLLLVFVTAAACKSEPGTDDPVNGNAKENLLKATQIGVYQDGKSEFLFDQKTQQLYISPSDGISRIQDDSGSQYVELQLGTLPTVGKTVAVTLRNNVGLKISNPANVEVLKSQDDLLWLWSESTVTGYIIPMMAE